MNSERKSFHRSPWLMLVCAVLWTLVCVGYIFDAVKMNNHSFARIITIVATAVCAAAFGWIWSKTRNRK